MILKILKDNDVLTKDLLARPLCDMRSSYSNGPENYFGWNPIGAYIGECWFKDGKTTVGQFKNNKYGLGYEFAKQLTLKNDKSNKRKNK